LIFLSIAGQLIFRSLRFKALFENLVDDARISFVNSFLLTSASFFVALATPNKAGDMLRGLFYNSRRWEITAISIIEYLMDCLIVLIIPVVGLVFVYRSYRTEIIIGYAVFILGGAIVAVVLKYLPMDHVLSRVPVLHRYGEGGSLLKTHVGRGLGSTYVWSTGLLFTSLTHGLYFAIFFLVLHKLGAEVSMLETVVTTGAGFMIGALTFVPMGMGTRDASVFGLLLSVGTESEIAMSSVIIMRSLSLSLVFFSGLCYFVSIRRLKGSEGA